MQKDYPLTHKSTVPELVDVLKGLIKDAKEEMTPLAVSYMHYQDPSQRAKAMFYMGQIEILGSLVWALSGDEAGDNSEISIRHPDE